jgi:hypothetical protein
VINADAELQASKVLAEAAQAMADTPSALQLRLLQTVVAVAAEKNSTLVLPFPVELLRFLERAHGGTAPAPDAPEASKPAAPAPPPLKEPPPLEERSAPAVMPPAAPGDDIVERDALSGGDRPDLT